MSKIERVVDCKLELPGPQKPVPAKPLVPVGRGPGFGGGGGGGGGGYSGPEFFPKAVAKWVAGGGEVVLHQDGDKVTLTPEQFRLLVENAPAIMADLKGSQE